MFIGVVMFTSYYKIRKNLLKIKRGWKYIKILFSFICYYKVKIKNFIVAYKQKFNTK